MTNHIYYILEKLPPLGGFFLAPAETCSLRLQAVGLFWPSFVFQVFFKIFCEIFLKIFSRLSRDFLQIFQDFFEIFFKLKKKYLRFFFETF